MSASLVEHQIRTFIKDKQPGVLCIKGRWGVGKTFTWQKWHKEELGLGTAGLPRSSYTSLFGLNSLEELRRSIFENTEVSDAFLASDTVTVGQSIGERVYGYVRKKGSLVDLTMAATRRKDTTEALFRIGFLSVRNQLVCFDDLERAGEKLPIRDVLGLASMLKEQRGCQVVLLLNDEQLEVQARQELERQLEKVVDVSLVFDPTSEEAARIALAEGDWVSDLLRDRVVKLGITNIRVIKKVERLARALNRHLAGLEQAVAESAIKTAVIAGWAHLQPDIAISLAEIERFNPYDPSTHLASDERETRRRLIEYGFGGVDELAAAVIEGVKKGFFNIEDVRAAGERLQAELATAEKNPMVRAAWKLYRESLQADDQVILNALENSSRTEIRTIDVPSFDAILSILRRHRGNRRADRLVALFIGRNENLPRVIEDSDAMELAMLHDERLKRAIGAAKVTQRDDRDPLEVIRHVAKSSSFSDADARLIRNLHVAEVEELIRRADGPDLRRVIEWALRLSRQPVEGQAIPSTAVEAAIHSIASRSPLRAERLAAWGFLIGTPHSPRKARKRRRPVATWKAELKATAQARLRIRQ